MSTSTVHPLIDFDLDLDAPGDLHDLQGGAVAIGRATDAGSRPLLAARNDSAMARAFLNAHALSQHSLKSTRKDLGRFLLWCRQEGKSLEQLCVEDLIAYKAFLTDPQPAEYWISSTKWPRTDPRWRPFTGPLAPISATHAFRAVKALLGFAKEAGYLPQDAGALVKNAKTVREARVSRYLDATAIAHVYALLDAESAVTLPARRAQARNRFLFIAYVTTGARLSEIAGAKMGALYGEADGRWWLDVLGKGNKRRRLPVPLALLDAYRQYRARYGLAPHTTRDDATPLVLGCRSDGTAGIGDEAVSKAIKALFMRAAERADNAGDPDAAVSLRAASAHWLRHTMLTTHANNAVSLKALQDTAGHASIATTAMYLHKSDQERHDEILHSLRLEAARASADGRRSQDDP